MFLSSNLLRLPPAALLLAVALLQPAPAQATGCPSPNPGALHKLVQDAFLRFKLKKSLLWVEGASGPLYFEGLGGATKDSLFLPASTSKWVTAATLLRLVDEKRIALDDKVSKYLPSFTGAKAAITIRQCLSHASGLPEHHWSLNYRNITLAQAVSQIAKVKLVYAPGTTFYYGSVSFQVAARVAEVVTNQDFESVVRSRITGPLGMTATDFQGWGATKNPLAALSLRTTPRDMMKFLRMLRDRGTIGSRRILSKASVDAMFTNQIKGLKYVKNPYSDAPYGIGSWLDGLDPSGKGYLVSHFGAFGFCPWIDFSRGIIGIYATQDSYYRAAPVARNIRTTLRETHLPLGLRCLGSSTPSCRGPIRPFADGIPKSGTNGFSVGCLDAPPNSFGVLAFGVLLLNPGQPLLGARLFIAGPPFLVLSPLRSSSTGSFSTSLDFRNVVGPSKFLLQFLWLNPKGCGTFGSLSASPALEVRVQ